MGIPQPSLFASLSSALLLSACVHSQSSNLTLEDFAFLERGMAYEQIVDELGEPQGHIEGSPAFVTYIYELEDRAMVYLGIYPQADYLDSAYYYITTADGREFEWLVPSRVDLPPGVRRDLTLNDFAGLTAGSDFFFDVYNKVGGPNATYYFEGGQFGMVYYLSDGARISMTSHGGYRCITTVNYSPESFGINWTTLSDDTLGICDEKKP